MEDALTHTIFMDNRQLDTSLNPCCNGRCTRTFVKEVKDVLVKFVLILVVMEDALALVDYDIEEVSKMGLNPCCNGRCTRTR